MARRSPARNGVSKEDKLPHSAIRERARAVKNGATVTSLFEHRCRNSRREGILPCRGRLERVHPTRTREHQNGGKRGLAVRRVAIGSIKGSGCRVLRDGSMPCCRDGIGCVAYVRRRVASGADLTPECLVRHVAGGLFTVGKWNRVWIALSEIPSECC
jgi:hypothetical protein